MKQVDVLVVGGGPAGSATAYHLARRGVDVLLVDKATFPREKVCGDGLAPRGVKALLGMDIDTDEPGFIHIEGLRSYGLGVEMELRWPPLDTFPTYGLVRTRHDLDHLLLQQATKAGAVIWEDTEAVAPNIDGAWVTGASLRHNGTTKELRARFVVACDGASSRFGQRAGINRNPARPIGIAARRYFRSPREQPTFFESWLDLRSEDAFMPGYGWVFPVGDGVLNVGAGLLNTFRDFKGLSARRVYDTFLATLPTEWELTEENAIGPLLSGPLPMGMNRRPLAVPGLLLAGDAAGVVNPFNGEGIAYAIESGELAAELLSEALVRDRPGLAQVYPSLLRERYGRYYSLGRAFVRAIGQPWVMRASVRYGLPQRRLMAFLLRLMGNLGEGPTGTRADRIISALVRLAPER